MDVEARHARRAARQRAVRRRRRQVTALLVAVCAAVAVLVLAGQQAGTPNQALQPTRAGQSAAQAGQGAGSRPPSASATPAGRAAEPVPLLMYHVIAAPPAGAPFPGLYVTPGEFAAQMRALKRAGWHAVTLDQLAAHWTRGAALGAGKPIVLSFDNGYRSQYTQALPVLRQLGWVGDENIQLAGLPPSQGGLGQQQVRGLLAAGWELDTQGYSHADLIRLDAQQLHYQVAVARTTLQRRFRVPVNWFCYPSGHYDATVIAAVKAAGYVGSTTVVPGWAHAVDDPFRLHRLRVLGGTSPDQLLTLITDSRHDPPAPATYAGR
jgi:peptidoglycan/xylan/chitin deacetylase (PgdA/CDA1 family)